MVRDRILKFVNSLSFAQRCFHGKYEIYQNSTITTNHLCDGMILNDIERGSSCGLSYNQHSTLVLFKVGCWLQLTPKLGALLRIKIYRKSYHQPKWSREMCYFSEFHVYSDKHFLSKRIVGQ